MGPLERRSSTVSQASVISEDDAGWESVGTPSAEISDEVRMEGKVDEEPQSRAFRAKFASSFGFFWVIQN